MSKSNNQNFFDWFHALLLYAFYRANIAKKMHLFININEMKKEKTTKVVRNSTYMYRELANLCEKRKKYSRNVP